MESKNSYSQNEEEGYPTEIFMNTDIVSDFMCPICLNVLRDPVVDNCQHMFCKVCAKRIKNKICPLSREPLENLSLVPKQLLSFMEKQKVKCLNFQKGCTWTGGLEQLQNHVDHDCIIYGKKCLICEGSFQMRKQFDEHLEKNAKEHYYQMEKLLKTKKYQTAEILEQMFEKQFIISIHEHPVELVYNNLSWYCDSLTDAPDKICEMGHQLSQHSVRNYPKFKCTQGCNRTYCPRCAFKYIL